MGITNRAAERADMEPTMTSHIRSIAVLLMVGAALAASPVLAADSVDGNRGPADRGLNRDAPMSLPGPVSAQPTPKVDAGALSRSIFGQDEATALDGLATLSVSADGTTSETPASGDLRDIFEAEVQGRKAGK
jgi:hypothetical protein